jgi:hypothetical protein
MYYLSLLLYPLVIGWSIYSLLHHTYRSWWSWLINSAAKGVYAFGFLLMTPQIFINYKMKSVAHMPWRAMTYKVNFFPGNSEFLDIFREVYFCILLTPPTFIN